MFRVIDRPKVPLTRVRDKQNREGRLGGYELFQLDSPRVWDNLTRDLDTNYGPVVKDFAEAYGVEKSMWASALLRLAGKHSKLLAKPASCRYFLRNSGHPHPARSWIRSAIDIFKSRMWQSAS